MRQASHPRPHAVSHNEQYRKLIKGTVLHARVQYDIDTMRNGSLMFDLMIIAKTLAVVWRDQSAY